MTERFYLDTSIWLDYYENRGKNGKTALDLLKNIVKKGCSIVFSNFHILELKHLGYSAEEIIRLFSVIKSNLVRAHITHEQKELARKIAIERKIPKGDALHAILARDNEALLITNDRHFQKLKDMAVIKRPKEILFS